MTYSPIFATKFLLEPMGGKSAQQEWYDVFGGSTGLKKIGQLLDNQFPFFLLAQQENFRFYVKLESIRCDYDNKYATPSGTVTFMLIQGNSSVDGTNCLLQQFSSEHYYQPSSCPKSRPHLCVEDYQNWRDSFGPCLSISYFDPAEVVTLEQKYLFDFVPRSENTFAIRSHYNRKFVRCDADVHLLDKLINGITKYREFYQVTSATFPVDASLETATEFVLSPGTLG